MKCSIAIKPDTNVDVLYPILDDKDLDIFMILIMVKKKNNFFDKDKTIDR